MKRPSEQQRLVRESGYAGVLSGISLYFLLSKTQTIASFESFIAPTSWKLAALVGWLLVPLFFGFTLAAAVRGIIYKFGANTPPPYARTISAARSLAVVAAVYYFAIRPTFYGSSPLLPQGLVFISTIHLLAIAGKVWGAIKVREGAE